MTLHNQLGGLSETFIAQCQRYRLVPIRIENGILYLASDHTPSPQALSTLRFMSDKPLHLTDWPTSQVDIALQQLTSGDLTLDLVDATHPSTTHSDKLETQHSLHDLEASQDDPVVEFIHDLLQQALERRASDIHFEPYANSYRIRLRIDGLLQESASPPSSLAARIAARLKVMAQLNIAERRLPQDGQMTLQHATHHYGIRVATLPVIEGEKVVLRVMESGRQPLAIDQLGMPEPLQQQYQTALNAPQGLILVTGPTGSGKTVSLYSGLNYLNHPQRNICSIEDPVEITLAGINQTQVNLKIGLSFSQALRAFLRQDPDVIMVGEIRDKETAEIAVQAAQTGHLVLSTLHTNSTVDTLLRLNQIGIANYLLIASLNLIIAQRLVRRLCPYCKQPAPQSATIQHADDHLETIAHWQAAGCEHCFGGYYGRMGLYEMLSMTNIIQHALLDGATTAELQQLATEQGMLSLFESGVESVKQGDISLNELYRVVGNARRAPQV